MLKKTICTFFVFCCIHFLSAQEYSLYRNYLFNNFYNLNPAACGYDGAFISQVSSSKKWLGINGSPSSQVFGNSIRLGEEEFYDPNMHLNRPFINLAKRVGLGFTVFNETSGPLRHTGLLFAYAYHLHLYNSRLSLGLSGLIAQYKLDTDEFKPVESDDPILYAKSSAIIPDINFGMLFYNRKLFYGISANGLMNFNKIMDHTNTFPEIIGCGGYKFKLTKEFEFEPSLFIFRSGEGKFSTDVNAKLYFLSKYWFLLSYQVNRELQLGVAMYFKPGLQLCYSYAINTKGLATYYQGSQIISLRVDVTSLVKKHHN
jgi:type IX secretion system PorP/SprF family membrane protein